MKKAILISILLLTAWTDHTWAQCPFTPAITPERMLLCPDTKDTLWTGLYDSYQWYKAGTAIPGATQQYYVVDYYLDAGSRFSVEVTDAGCTEMSDDMLVDGWVFLGVTVMSGGKYRFDGSRGVNVLCDSTAMHARDTMILTLNMPYNTNIRWFKDGRPVPGAVSNVLYVTETGDYMVEGAPAPCPDYIRQLGATIRAELRKPVKPVIIPHGDRLVAGPAAADLRDFQWYLEGQMLPGATDSSYIPLTPGNYTVSASDGFCSDLSDLYNLVEFPGNVSGIGLRQNILIYPNPATSLIHVRAPLEVHISVISVDGRVVIQATAGNVADISALADGLYVVKVFDKEGKMLKAEKFRKVPAGK